MKFLILFSFFSIFLPTNSSDFCVIHNILNNNEINVICDKKKIIFGFIDYESNKKDLKYQNDKELKLKIPSKYYYEITDFINKYCYKKKDSLKIKEIINLNKSDDMKYLVKIIISCEFKQ